MKIYSWNVNGIRAVLKKGDWEQFIAAEAPDLICLQETKAQSSDVDYPFGGYDVFWHSAAKKGYSGTAILTKKHP